LTQSFIAVLHIFILKYYSAQNKTKFTAHVLPGSDMERRGCRLQE